MMTMGAVRGPPTYLTLNVPRAVFCTYVQLPIATFHPVYKTKRPANYGARLSGPVWHYIVMRFQNFTS